MPLQTSEIFIGYSLFSSSGSKGPFQRVRYLIHKNVIKWCIVCCVRTNIDIDENLVRKARKLTRLKSKRQIVDRALELLVRSESRKGILRYYGSGIWKGDAKALRRNRI